MNQQTSISRVNICLLVIHFVFWRFRTVAWHASCKNKRITQLTTILYGNSSLRRNLWHYRIIYYNDVLKASLYILKSPLFVHFCCKTVVLRCPYTWSQKRRFFRSPWSLYISYVVNLIPSSVISVHKHFCSFLDFEHSSLIFLWWTGDYLDLPWASVDYGKVVIYWRFFGPEERNCVF